MKKGINRKRFLDIDEAICGVVSVNISLVQLYLISPFTTFIKHSVVVLNLFICFAYNIQFVIGLLFKVQSEIFATDCTQRTAIHQRDQLLLGFISYLVENYYGKLEIIGNNEKLNIAAGTQATWTAILNGIHPLEPLQ